MIINNFNYTKIIFSKICQFMGAMILDHIQITL